MEEALEFATAESFGLQPWEYDQIPLYWIRRRGVFALAWDKVRYPEKYQETKEP